MHIFRAVGRRFLVTRAGWEGRVTHHQRVTASGIDHWFLQQQKQGPIHAFGCAANEAKCPAIADQKRISEAASVGSELWVGPAWRVAVVSNKT